LVSFEELLKSVNMKQTILVATALCLTLGATSCVKEYTCNCSYVDRPDPITGATLPNKEERPEVRARTLEQAQLECGFQEDKYFGQGYDGTCNVDR
jgi:hypothetical protein